MTHPNFEGVQSLHPDDPSMNWGDVTKIDHGLLLKVDKLAALMKTKLYVTSGFRPNDFGSQHALGLALDIMAPDFTGDLLDFYLSAEKVGFKGVGVYPSWHYAGHTVGGLHVDERLGKAARWMGVLENGKQKYIAMSGENLKKYGVI